jgi:hypothetical protein
VTCQFSYQLVASLLSGFTSCVPRSVFRYNSCVSLASHAAGVKTDPVKVGKVIRSEKRKDFLSVKASSSVSKKFLLTIWNDGVVLIKNVDAT